MAVQTFEEIIAAAQLSADERKLFDNIVQKNPSLKEGYLRQDDYSRKTQALKAQEAEYEASKQTAAKWDAWADEKVPIWKKLVEKGAVTDDGDLLWPTEKESLEAQLVELKRQSVAGGDVDPAELDKRITDIVKTLGGVTREEMAALTASEAKKMAEEAVDAKYATFETNFNEKTIPFVAGFSTAMAVQASRYEKETGKEFTAEVQKEYFDLMAKEKNYDPYEIGTKYLEPIRSAKKTEEEIERRATEKARDMGTLPGGGSEGRIPQGEQRGSLQRMLEDSKDEGDVESRIMAAGREAAKELWTEGKR